MAIRDALQRNGYIVVLLTLVVMVHGALYLHILRDFPAIASSNDTQYSNISTHIVRDGVYSTGKRDADGDLIPTASQPPLYTLLFAASYRMFGMGSAANEPMRILLMLANVGVIVVSWRIGSLFSARVANGTATLAALDLTAFYFAQNYDIPDVLLGFFMALWLYHLVRFLRGAPPVRSVAWSTVSLGLAMLTKIAPFLLWIPIGVLLVMYCWRAVPWDRVTKLRTCGVFVCIIALFFGGWKVRNLLTTGSSSFASGSTTLRWNAAYVIAYQRGIPQAEARELLSAQYFPPELLAQGEGAVEREGGRAMARILIGSPVDFGVVVLRAMPGFFFGTFPPYLAFSREEASALRMAVGESRGHRALLPRLWADREVGYLLLYGLAKLHLVLLYGAAVVAAVVFARRRELRWILAFFLVTIVYTVVVSGASAQPRYRTMIFPIFYALGGYGAVYVWDRWVAFRSSRSMVRM